MDQAPLPGCDQLYDAAPCGHLLARPDGQLLHANTTLCRWLGYELGALQRVRLNELFTAGGRIFFHTHLQPLLRMQGSVAEVKLELRRQDGQPVPMILNIAEQAWQGERLLHIGAFVAEDRHKYERELLAQRRRAEELLEQHARDQADLSQARGQAEDRAKLAEQLVGIVSHDIRNPLAVVQMSAALLERTALSGPQGAAVARIGRAVQRMQHLIADLLDFSEARLGAGLRIAKSQVDLHAAIAEAVQELGVAFPGRELRHEKEGPGAWHADANRIAQAIGNLVANAANHGAAGRPVLVRTAGRPDAFELSVHNEGPAIPPALLPVLFDPMVRGAGSGQGAQGVGLGLFIVREIARAHAGEVQVRSTAADGTTFTITLPRAS